MTSSLPPITISPLQRLSGLVRQPVTISTIASLGVHAAILFLAPSLPNSKASNPEEPQTVNVVQLSPEEQRRLPNFSRSIPGLNNPFVAANPNLYGSASLPSPSSLPNPSSLPPLGMPNLSQAWDQVNQDNNSFTIPTTQTDSNSFPKPNPLPSAIRSTPTPKPSSESKATSTPESTPTPDAESTPSPEPTPTPTLPTAKDALRRRDGQVTGDPGYVRSIEGTTDDDRQKSYIALTGQLAQDGEPYDPKVLDEQLLFPGATCPKDTGTAVVAVVVNPDGTIAVVQMMQKTGYPALDSFSEATARAKTFPPSKVRTLYGYRFTFAEPEGGCKATSTSPSPTPDSSPTPDASPTPNPSPAEPTPSN